MTSLTQKETVTAITELIHCNQPVPVSPSANLFEGANVNEYYDLLEELRLQKIITWGGTKLFTSNIHEYLSLND